MIGEEGEEIVKKIDDIDDPNHYSIELEKQKAEHDRMVKLAEEKKQVIEICLLSSSAEVLYEVRRFRG